MASTTQRRVSRFKKRMLIPFWLVQTGLVALTTAVYSLQLYASNFGAKFLILVTFSMLAIIFIIIEITSFICHHLRPITYLTIQCVKTAMWLGMLLYAAIHTIAAQNQNDGYGDWRTITVAIHIAIIFSFIATLIYASVIFHRHRYGKIHLSQTPLLTNTQRIPTPTTNTNSPALDPLSRSISAHDSHVSPASTPHQSQISHAATLGCHPALDGARFSEHRVSEIDGKERPHTAIDALMALPVRPPLPPYFERLSSIGRGGGDREGSEVFELAAMRGGRRGGIAVH